MIGLMMTMDQGMVTTHSHTLTRAPTRLAHKGFSVYAACLQSETKPLARTPPGNSLHRTSVCMHLPALEHGHTSMDTSRVTATTPAKTPHAGRDTTGRHAGAQAGTPTGPWLEHRGHGRDTTRDTHRDTVWDTTRTTKRAVATRHASTSSPGPPRSPRADSHALDA